MVIAYVFGTAAMIFIDFFRLKNSKQKRLWIVYFALAALFLFWGIRISKGESTRGPEEIVDYLFQDVLGFSMESWQ
jgi:hypothetical protein